MKKIVLIVAGLVLVVAFFAHLLIAGTIIVPDLHYQLCPDGLGFGEVQLGSSRQMDLTVSNPTDADIAIGTVTPPSAPYAVIADTCSQCTLHPGDNCSITVEFSPIFIGTFYDQILIPTDDPEQGTLVVSLSGSGATDSITFTYEYDDLYRLTKVTYPDGTVIEYTYDEAGNRLSVIVFYYPVLIWGSAGTGDGQFDGPGGVAVDSQGYVYVADRGNDRIQKFDSEGTFITAWGSSGTGDGQFNKPHGIIADSQGYIYVAERENDRIQKFDSSGNYIAQWGSSGSGEGQFNDPCGLAVDSAGYIYVADRQNDRIQKFDSSGTFITAWGSFGTGDGQFKRPLEVAVDNQGYVYVTDMGNNRVEKFDSSCTFVATWGSLGAGNGEFTKPTGIEVDNEGYVYVADRDNNRIQKFDASGNYVAQWGSSGSGDGQFDKPIDIAIDSQGYIYVTDGGNNRIQKFSKAE